MTISPDNPSTSAELSCLAQATDADGEDVTIQYQWINDQEVFALGDSFSLTPDLFQPMQKITCVATVSDGKVEFTEQTSITIENSPPEIQNIDLNPSENPKLGETVVCEANAVDVDDDEALTLTYSWLHNDIDIGNGTELLLSPETFAEADVVTCVAQVTDSFEGTTSTSVSVVIGNTSPVVGGLNIEPNAPTSQDTLTCTTSELLDMDEDDITISYEWLMDGTLQSEDSNSLSGPFAVGAEIKCQVTPNDGKIDGETIEDNTTIINTAPILESTDITPNTVFADSLILCETVASDLDEELLQTNYLWSDQNGTLLGTAATLQLDPSIASVSDEITCQATTTDPHDSQAQASVAITIENSVPTVTTPATITADPTPITTSTLACAAAFDDLNDNNLNAQYEWTTATGSIISTTYSYTVLASQTNTGDVLTCTASAEDSNGDIVTSSSSVTIINSAPSIDALNLSPNPAHSQDSIICTVQTATDIDADAISYTYAWTITGQPQSNTTNTLSGPFSVGSTVSCSVIPNDGKEDGNVQDAHINISNSAPLVESVSVGSGPFFTDDAITATAVLSDIDSEQSIVSNYEWHVYYGSTGSADLIVQNGTSELLDGSQFFEKGDSVYVVVTGNDGVEDSNSLSTTPMPIGNSAPTDLIVSINTNPDIYNDSILICSATVDDSDSADTITYDFTWSTGDNGENLILDGSMPPGTSLTCTATATDGTDSIADSIDVTLQNRVPVIDNLMLSPASSTAKTTELTCTAVASDEDGESVVVNYEWSVDGVIQSESGSNLAGTFSYGQTIQCTVTPSDATSVGIAKTMSVAIQNTVPTVDSVLLNQTAVHTNDTLTAAVFLSDIDTTHTVTASYEWHVIDSSDGGTDRIATVVTASLSGADQHFGRDDQVYVIVTPNDGVEDGLPLTSSPITIENTPPTAPTILLEGASDPAVSFLDDLICMVDSLATDADPEDSVMYNFDWVRSNGDITQSVSVSDTEDTLGSTLVSGGEWTCEVTATDGTDLGTTVSEAISVEYNTDMTRRTEVLECVVEADGCDVVLSPVDNTASPFHNSIMPGSYGVHIGTAYAGQTLCIPSGNYKSMYLYGLQGTANAPVVITNCGQGQVIIDGEGSRAISADDGQYLHFTGTGDPDQLYGFVVSDPGNSRSVIRMKGDEMGVTDIEIEYFELMGPAYAGISISNYPYCNPDLDRSVFTQTNTLIHHNYIHDIRNSSGVNGGEGIYLGGSHYFMSESPTSSNCSTGYAEPSLRGVQVYQNLVEDTGRDGIQVGGAVEGMSIHHNTVRRYALAQDFGHIGGIQVNPGSVGHVYANLVESDPSTTSETAFQVAGGEDGPTYIYNNIVVDASIPLAFLTNMGNESSPIHVHNNTFINKYIAPTEGVSSSGTSTLYLSCSFDGSGTIQDFYITNNIFTNYGSVGRYIYGTVGSHYSKYYSDDGCPINGTPYGNDLDVNLILDNNLYEQDPTQVGFVDYTGGDYHLDSNSSSIGAGEDLSNIFTEDFDGNDRGTTMPFDMGAYNYQ